MKEKIEEERPSIYLDMINFCPHVTEKSKRELQIKWGKYLNCVRSVQCYNCSKGIS